MWKCWQISIRGVIFSQLSGSAILNKKEQTEDIINKIKENNNKEKNEKKEVKKPKEDIMEETTYEFEYDQMEDE